MLRYVVYRVTIVWGMLFVMLFHFSYFFACHMLVATREFSTADRCFCFVIDIEFDPCDLNVGGFSWHAVVLLVHCGFHLARVFHCIEFDFRTIPAMVPFAICSCID